MDKLKGLTLLIMLIVSLCCMSLQCNKRYLDPTYQFEEKIDIVPAKTAYQVGDTIWMKYQNPGRQLYDKISNKKVTLDSATISLQFFYNHHNQSSQDTMPAGGYADLYIPPGLNCVPSSLNQTQLFYVHPDCAANFGFMIGVIPKVKGAFQLVLGNNTSLFNCYTSSYNLPYALLTFNFSTNNSNLYAFSVQ